jgi:hypothetical protein
MCSIGHLHEKNLEESSHRRRTFMKFFRCVHWDRKFLLKKLHDIWRKIALIVILRAPSGSFQSPSLPGFYDWKNKSGSLMMMRRKVNSACIWFSLSHTLFQWLCYNRFMSKALAEIESHGRKLALERLLHFCSLPLVCVCIPPIWKTKKRSTNVKKQTDKAKCKEAETASVGSTHQADASYPQDMQRAATRNACLSPGIMFFFLDSRISQTFIDLLARIQKS